MMRPYEDPNSEEAAKYVRGPIAEARAMKHDREWGTYISGIIASRRPGFPAFLRRHLERADIWPALEMPGGVLPAHYLKPIFLYHEQGKPLRYGHREARKPFAMLLDIRDLLLSWEAGGELHNSRRRAWAEHMLRAAQLYAESSTPDCLHYRTHALVLSPRMRDHIGDLLAPPSFRTLEDLEAAASKWADGEVRQRIGDAPEDAKQGELF